MSELWRAQGILNILNPLDAVWLTLFSGLGALWAHAGRDKLGIGVRVWLTGSEAPARMELLYKKRGNFKVSLKTAQRKPC